MWTYAGINSGSLVTTWKEEQFSLKSMGLGEEKKKLGIGPAYDDDGRWIRGTKLRVE